MASDRTEKATPKRREDARRKGQILRRPEIPSAVGFFVALLMLRALGEDLVSQAARLITRSISVATSTAPLSPEDVSSLMNDAVARWATMAMPIIVVLLVAGLASNFAQGGFTFTPTALQPKGERFNPLNNLKNSIGINGTLQFVKGIFVLSIIIASCYGVFRQAFMDAPSLVGAPAPQILTHVGKLLYELGLRIGAILLVTAAADYGYGWYRHEKSMKMTKQEIKDEYRQQEGDPMVKSQRRRAARAMLQKHIAKEVPTADVVVTNPTHFAVALRYDREAHAAPVVVAKGADLMAKRIREIAKEHKVMIVENPPLARSLFRSVEIGRPIPADLFRAVAELLAYVYRQRTMNQ